jgi:hypothetical protein
MAMRRGFSAVASKIAHIDRVLFHTATEGAKCGDSSAMR